MLRKPVRRARLKGRNRRGRRDWRLPLLREAMKERHDHLSKLGEPAVLAHVGQQADRGWKFRKRRNFKERVVERLVDRGILQEVTGKFGERMHVIDEVSVAEVG